MNPERRAIFQVHLAVLLFGFTAILGDLISLNALELVWWRLLFTCISIVLFLPVLKEIKNIPRNMRWIYAGIGVITATHWLTFYGSIKWSNPSTTLICMATTTVFTACIEPLLLKKKFSILELGLGFIIIPAMFFIAAQTPSGYQWGMVLGIISALLAACFAVLNKKYVDQASPASITFLELGAGGLFLTVLLSGVWLVEGKTMQMPSGLDFVYLLILAVLCTTVAFILTLKALKHISAFAANLTINLEPVYGIIMAYFILDDASELNARFYLGSAIILSVVFIYFFLRKREPVT